MGARFCNVKHLKYEWGRAFDFGEIEEQLARGNWEALAIVTMKLHRVLLKMQQN